MGFARPEADQRLASTAHGPLQALERLAWLAALLCATPLAYVAARDRHGRWHSTRHDSPALAPTPDIPPVTDLLPGPGALVCADLRCGGPLGVVCQALGTTDVRSCAIVPVHDATGAVIAACGVFDPRPRAYADEQTDALHAIALQAAEALRSHDELVSLRERESAYQARLGDAHDRALGDLAEELHEGISQDITGVALLVAAAAQRALALDQSLAAELRDIAALLTDTIETCRIAAQAHDGYALAHDGLACALDRFIDGLDIGPGRTCTFEASSMALGTIDERAGGQLLRIAQEAIHNAVRHSDGDRIRVTLTQGAAGMLLMVEDNGSGAAAGAPADRGIGLAIMRYRALAIGASLACGYEASRGYVVRCELPPCVRAQCSSGDTRPYDSTAGRAQA